MNKNNWKNVSELVNNVKVGQFYHLDNASNNPFEKKDDIYIKIDNISGEYVQYHFVPERKNWEYMTKKLYDLMCVFELCDESEVHSCGY